VLAHKKLVQQTNKQQTTPEPIRIIVSQTQRVGSQKYYKLRAPPIKAKTFFFTNQRLVNPFVVPVIGREFLAVKSKVKNHRRSNLYLHPTKIGSSALTKKMQVGKDKMCFEMFAFLV
jgi:hypothetical protein